MAKTVSFDFKNVAGMASAEDIAAIKEEVVAAKSTLVNKTGEGNDFLGWIDLPVDYDKEEFARIILWPPASKPSATTASTPACWLFRANFVLEITCATLHPASCRRAVQVFGLPAEVNTAGTRSSMMTPMISSA